MRDAEVDTRELHVLAVPRELVLDPVELDVREVVRLDHVREIGVDLLDLREDVLGLRALRGEVGGVGCRPAGHGERRDEDEQGWEDSAR